MNNTDFQSHSLNQKEKFFGACWLIFETFFFSALLQLFNKLLPTPMPQTVVNFVFFTVNFTAVALLFRKYLGAQYRLVPDTIGKILAGAVIGFMAYWVFSFLLMQILLALDPGFTSINDTAIQTLVAQDYALMFVGTVILAPITEETLFRGLIFRGLHDHMPVLAWILSVVFFSLVHIFGYIGAYPFTTLLLCFLQYIPAGICLAGAYRLSGCLLSPILIHGLVNFVAMLSLR